MLKKISVFILFLLIPLTVSANFENETNDVLKDISSYTEGFDFYEFSENLLKSGELPSGSSLLSEILDFFGRELRRTFKSLSVLLIPVFLFGILRFIRTERGEEGISSAAFIGCFAFMCVIITGSFKDMAGVVLDTAATIDIITKSLVPVLFSLLTATGNITQASLVQPFVLTVSQIMCELLKSYILPLVLTAFALSLTESITNVNGLKYFGELIFKITKWVLVFLVVFFLSVLSAQSLAASGLDTVAVKSTKFAVSNFIPVVGGAIADGVETLGLSLKTIKNAAGISGVAGIIYICFVPLVKIYAASLLFHIMAALSYPVSDKRFGDILSFAGSTMAILGGIILSMAFIFVVTAAVIIGTNPAMGV